MGVGSDFDQSPQAANFTTSQRTCTFGDSFNPPLQGLIIRTATLGFLIRSRKGVRIENCLTNLHSTWIAKCRRRITNWHSNVYGNESANMEDARAKYTGSWHASLSAWSRLNACCSRNALSEVCGRVSKHKH
jgi:hypothetical protein